MLADVAAKRPFAIMRESQVNGDSLHPPSTDQILSAPAGRRRSQSDCSQFYVMADGWAFERGSYSIILDPKAGGASLNDRGKYITLYKREPTGNWRMARWMARDIWNSSVSPPRL